MKRLSVHMTPLPALLLCGLGVFAQANSAPQEPPKPTPNAYTLEAGDVVDIKFFYNEELNTRGIIRPDGRISLPLLGEVQVAGSTIGDLSASLAKLYAPTLRKPVLTLQVEAFANRRIFVGGEVTRPGVFPLNGQQTALGAIFEAGGLTKTAKRGKITLIRKSQSGTPQVMVVSLKEEPSGKMGISPAATFLLEPFDVLVLHESGISKANRVVDQYIRQMSPFLLTGGFSYLFNGFFVR